MSISSEKMEVWLLICKPVATAKYPHWMITLTAPGSAKGFRVHSVGGPSNNKKYSLDISWKYTNSPGVATKELLGTTDSRNFKKMLAAAKRPPPQACQHFVLAVVSEFEMKKFLPPGTASALALRVRMGEQARLYREAHPVPDSIPEFLRRRAPRRLRPPPGRWLCFGCNLGFDTIEQAGRCECTHSGVRSHSVVLRGCKAVPFYEK